MRILKSKIFEPAILPVLTSLLLIVSYPKFNQGWLAWIALAPLTAVVGWWGPD